MKQVQEQRGKESQKRVCYFGRAAGHITLDPFKGTEHKGCHEGWREIAGADLPQGPDCGTVPEAFLEKNDRTPIGAGFN